MHCDGDVCVKCSDQAVAVRVVQLLDDDLAIVDTGMSSEEVSVAFVDAGVGDTLLVHAKEAIAVQTAGAPAAEPPA
jgi:hydrogenase expression/formation protein HypC